MSPAWGETWERDKGLFLPLLVPRMSSVRSSSRVHLPLKRVPVVDPFLDEMPSPPVDHVRLPSESLSTGAPSNACLLGGNNMRGNTFIFQRLTSYTSHKFFAGKRSTDLEQQIKEDIILKFP